MRPDGSVRWVLVKGGVFFTSEGAEREPVFSVGFAIDITERKVAERTLEASEQRYRTLIDNANDIVATLDLEGRFTSVNPIVGRILGIHVAGDDRSAAPPLRPHGVPSDA